MIGLAFLGAGIIATVIERAERMKESRETKQAHEIGKITRRVDKW
jgi:hypothetical protein